MGGRGLKITRAATAACLCLVAATARGDGVANVMTSKSLPPATLAVIDPESGTSSGGGSTDVNVGPGDIIFFRFNYLPRRGGDRAHERLARRVVALAHDDGALVEAREVRAVEGVGTPGTPSRAATARTSARAAT